VNEAALDGQGPDSARAATSQLVVAFFFDGSPWLAPQRPTSETPSIEWAMCHGPELFAVAHEYMHLALGHNDEAPAGLALLGDDERTVVLDRRADQEFEVDQLAFEFVVTDLAENFNVPRSFALVCGRLFFRWMLLIDEVARALRIPVSYGDHPSNADRLAALRGVFADPQADPLEASLDRVFQSLVAYAVEAVSAELGRRDVHPRYDGGLFA
jgi:hypothetical protein